MKPFLDSWLFFFDFNTVYKHSSWTCWHCASFVFYDARHPLRLREGASAQLPRAFGYRTLTIASNYYIYINPSVSCDKLFYFHALNSRKLLKHERQAKAYVKKTNLVV